MRTRFGMTLFVVLLGAGAYFYFLSANVCPTPLHYRIGQIDDGFAITPEDAKATALGAEALWEGKEGRDLFVYDDSADFTINFVYDDRQALSDQEENFKNRLDAAENINDSLVSTYNNLVSDYEKLKSSYETKVSEYETRLSSYNEKVDGFNQAGGAPPKEFAALQKEKDALDKEQESLGQTVDQLNNMVAEINRLGEQGSKLIETYNRGVETYNKTFGEPREFTQGDYQGGFINIYTFDNLGELELVLAHEMGHSLGLGHVGGEQSIMYYLIGGQPSPLELSDTDQAEFVSVCEAPWWSRWKNLFSEVGLSGYNGTN